MVAGVTVEQVAEAGIVGAGGAGFPTHVKLKAQVDTVVLNGAECEPLLHKDKEILKHFPEEVMAGLACAKELVGARRAVVGVKGKYHDVIDTLRKQLPTWAEIAPLTDSYPSGDEFILVYDTLGRLIPPGGIPLVVGAVVINVETALNLAKAAAEPVIEKFLTVAGAVRQPVTVRVPIGASIGHCVELAGGATTDRPCYFLGGVMMGRVTTDPATLVDKTLGAVIVLPQDHPLAQRYLQTWKQIVRIGRSACDQCGYCTQFCPRWLLGHPIEPHRAMRSLGFNLVGQSDVAGTVFCCECNVCSLYACPEDLDPKNVCAENKRRLLAEGKRWQNAPFDQMRPRLHLADRRIPIDRLIHKLGLQRFRNEGHLIEKRPALERVGIPLKQHAGAPCEPIVRVGQAVTKGQVLGRPPVVSGKPALGAPVHASVDGVVSAIENGIVWIKLQTQSAR
ncbi:MAG: 4Fe-4S dicluster domain-containing protein [Thermoguttaceae bacterium]|nr:4Fe-4S dicluster domain-containing protein [Thermoguttaceae bacterium]MDW8079800.1 4Fe-4S dicluster domain-containing protein [Thermoguttaceae bacterium]